MTEEEVFAIWMEYNLIISLPRYFKNRAIFKLIHKALDIAWNVTKFHEERKKYLTKKKWVT
jgi:hypothetical protein